MFVLFFFIFFFVYIVNFLFPLIIIKQQTDEKLFNSASSNLLTTVSCLDDNWIVISRNLRAVNIGYYTRNGIPLSCDMTPNDETDVLTDCGTTAGYNTFNSPCYNAMTNVMYYLTQ